MLSKVKEIFKTLLNNTSTITVNGKKYKGSNSVVITSNNVSHQIIVDGNVVSTEEGVELNVHIEGTCGDVESKNGNITVNGDVKDVTSTNGDINITGSTGNAQTVNGDVRARNINGKVNTVNGDITV